MGIAGHYGATLQALLVESAADPNLRVALYGGSTIVRVADYNNDGMSAVHIGLDAGARQIEFNGTSWDRIRHSFNQSTGSINSNGAGTTLNIATTPMSKFSLIVILTVGSSAYVVDIEGSVNGNDWVALGSLSSSASPDMVFVVDKAVDRIRYNVTTIGGGNTMTVRLLASAR
ncbi:hypothetical protein LCGC14_0908120 [marine sediment metagenome]|uniref:Uncharacterized protein n=1 Tax=marine sediment metagenome TaxID=412755 RepID=A0A0F9NUG7_9ZZZZ